ncbi:MAG: hypothetical protein EBQ92_06895 [Proteobacteria bacterium]|jgi:hypothetical protein|nr:hypothetical protein [Pseudomonadota bacterium]
MKNKIKVIDSFWVFLVATAFLGPFALPLLWRNPNWSKRTKIIGSIAVIAFTLVLLYSLTFLKDLAQQLEIEIP